MRMVSKWKIRENWQDWLILLLLSILFLIKCINIVQNSIPDFIKMFQFNLFKNFDLKTSMADPTVKTNLDTTFIEAQIYQSNHFSDLYFLSFCLI